MHAVLENIVGDHDTRTRRSSSSGPRHRRDLNKNMPKLTEAVKAEKAVEHLMSTARSSSPPVDSAKEFVGADRPGGRADRGRRRNRGRRARRARLRDPADAARRGRAVDGAARRGLQRWLRRAGSHLLVRGDDEPVGDAQAVPGPRERMADLRDGRQGRGLPAAELEAGDPAQADAAAFRNHGITSPRRQLGRWSDQAEEASTSSARPRRPSCSSTTAAWWACARRQGPRPRRRGALELRAGRRPDRQGHRARRGHAILTGAAIRHFDLGLEDPQQRSSGSRRCGRSRSRSTGSSTRWPGRFASAPSTRSSAARSSTRWVRTASRWASSAGWTTATPPSASTTLCSS